ncbi:AAA family ATPase [Croceicoccus sp. BE223]|uniref:AAA family ATPase n=1 Tax=Croceicoccus sp. BE223 TaxID=2817716 RepID=UPI0028635906|nr:AAA family ATPase [Croceicoccus sp. BE223]MDR7102637.1 pilus assembly protein CpaE [Croceicoccus sp. BE223]
MNRKLPSGIYAVAQSQHAAALKASLGDGINLVASPVTEDVSSDILSKASILVLEVDPGQPDSMARLFDVRSRRPSLPVIVALEHADLRMTRTLIRQGIADVATLPFDVGELTGQLIEVAARHAPAHDGSLAPMVSVVRAAGGVGATTLITHLAESMADCNGRPLEVCVIDLDLQFGQVANYLGLNPQTTVLDLLEASERLDSDLVRDAAVAAPQGIFVIGAPSQIAPLEEVDVDRLLNLVNVARQTFDFVLLDLPSNWTNWTLSAALACNEIMVVTDQSITGLRQTKRVIELFDIMQVGRENVRIIVNRVEKKLFQPIGVSEVADTLSREVSATVARDKGDLQMAQDRGVLLSESGRKSAFVKDIDRLADQICDRVVGN